MDLEQLEQAVAATMQDVLTLPITLSERRGARNRQETYLAFSLYAIRRTGVALNQKRLRMPTRHFAKGRSCRAMVFTLSEHPAWLAALWKRAGVVVEEGSQQFRTLRACWRKHASSLRSHLSRSTDWLTTAQGDLPSAALMHLRTSDPAWPLVGETMPPGCYSRICIFTRRGKQKATPSSTSKFCAGQGSAAAGNRRRSGGPAGAAAAAISSSSSRRRRPRSELGAG